MKNNNDQSAGTIAPGGRSAVLAGLQRRWYTKLKAGGFVDTELASSQHQAHPRSTTGDIGAQLRAAFWRRAELAAKRLPRTYPRRGFLVRVTQLRNVNRSSRELGLTQKAGEWSWRRFLVLADLPAPKVKGPSHGRGRPNRDEER